MNKATINLDYAGLGNQLFMVAALLGYSKKYNLLPQLKKYNDSKDEWGVKYLYNVFANIEKVDYFKEDIKYIENSDQIYTEINRYDNKDICLNGYFQTNLFFDNLSKEELGFEIKQINYDRYTIGLHVRRTNYLSLGWALSINYYINVLKFIPEEYKNKSVDLIVFTDDPQWCKDNILPIYSEFNISISEGKSDIEDMSYMSSCDQLIIANSSFSWWGAYLGKEKIVYAPQIWFVNYPYNQYILLNNWNRVPIY